MGVDWHVDAARSEELFHSLADLLINAANNIFRPVFKLFFVLYEEELVKLSIFFDHCHPVKRSCVEVLGVDDVVGEAELLIRLFIIVPV